MIKITAYGQTRNIKIHLRIQVRRGKELGSSFLMPKK